MKAGTGKAIELLSKEFSLSKDEIKESMLYFLEKKLRAIKAEIFKITGKYKVSSVEEFEDLYKKGSLEEKDSWSEFQKLDHLEFKRDELEKLLLHNGSEDAVEACYISEDPEAALREFLSFARKLKFQRKQSS